MNRYKNNGFVMLKLLPLLLLLYAPTGFAIEEPSEVNNDDEAAVVEDNVLELDRLTVTGEKLSLKKETRLRLVRHAMNEPRSSKKEDRDKLLCWMEVPVGTHFHHVTCARNGDLDALRLGGKSGQIGGSAGYGRHKIWRSLKAESAAGIRNILDGMPDNGYFDEEFVAIASSGGEPPRDVPNIEELKIFASAWVEVDKLTRQGQPEDRVIAAITADGMTLQRYNRIAVLAQSYQSIRAKVTELVLEQQDG
jgi:hypothetical protein